MKKISIIILLSVLLTVFSVSTNVFAADASLGVSTWYAWWRFGEGDKTLDPALLFGPVVSLRFAESLSIAGVFLYGKFKDEDDNGISRYDSDLSLNYNFNRYFKLFAGGKYMGYGFNTDKGDGTHWSAGPGMGIGSTLPLTESLYLLMNISGTYSFGKEDDGSEWSSDIVEKSFNGGISLAYYIKAASTSVNMGYRHQIVKTEYTDRSEYNKDTFYFYGPTFSAVYSF